MNVTTGGTHNYICLDEIRDKAICAAMPLLPTLLPF